MINGKMAVKSQVATKIKKNKIKNQWQLVLPSDQTNFEIFGSNCCPYVQRWSVKRYNNEYLHVASIKQHWNTSKHLNASSLIFQHEND